MPSVTKTLNKNDNTHQVNVLLLQDFVLISGSTFPSGNPESCANIVVAILITHMETLFYVETEAKEKNVILALINNHDPHRLW